MTFPTAGVDVGGTKILGVVLDGGRVVAEHRVPTPAGGEAVAAAVAGVLAQLRVTAPVVAAVGVGAPGLVDREGTLRFAPNLPGVVGFPMGSRVAELTGLPVVVDNDATCALRAEHHAGAAAGARHALLVTLGTGIGGGLLAEGRVLRGVTGFAGEVGHMVVDVDGVPCVCGRRGCWERYASGSGLGRLARDAAEAGVVPEVVARAGGDPLAVRGEHVTAAARDGDPAATAVLQRFASWVALGIGNLVSVLDVDLCVVGGGLADAGELLLDPVRRLVPTLLMGSEHRRPLRVEVAALGPDAGAIGAALLAGEPPD